MSPFLIQNRAIAIASYPFFYGLGLVVAGLVLGLLLSQRGFRFRDGIRVWAIACFLIVFGGRLLYILVYYSSETSTAGWFFSLNEGGEVLYGAMISAALGGWYASRRLKLPPTEVLDAAAVGAPLGIAIGRIGCLFKGCCYGTRWDGWCGICYPKVVDVYGNVIGSAAYLEQLAKHEIPPFVTWSLPVHPAPLYEFGFCLLLGAAMLWLWNQGVLSGRLVFVFIGTYAIWRFGVEFVRVRDEHLFGPLPIYQLISIGLFLVCAASLLVPRFFASLLPQRANRK